MFFKFYLIKIIPFFSESIQLNQKLQDFIEQCEIDAFSKNTLSILVITIKRESKQICRIPPDGKPTKKQQVLLRSSKCSNTVKTEHQQCINNTILQLQSSNYIQDPNVKIPYICWFVNF